MGGKLDIRTQLETVLHEIEACINSRLLTYVEENRVPLTPSHFLIGRNSPLLPVDVVPGQEVDDLTLRHSFQSEVIDFFGRSSWTSMLETYLLS